jgi:hypothetical protein
MFYTISDTGETVRVPLDLDTGAIDWLNAEPWQEPELLTPLPPAKRKQRYDVRRVVMTCTHCGYKRLQCQRTPCHRCREGVMAHNEQMKINILIKD